MGLYCEVSLKNLGFWPSTRNAGVVVDYNYGNQIFEKKFHEMTSFLCPVRTGNLLGSLSCEGNGMTIIATTDCEYAEYVEFGTWKQMAQPYFEESIQTAFAAAYGAWVEAYELALSVEWQFVFWEVYQQVMSNPKANPLFAELWAINAANVSVETQRTYLDVGPEIPDIIII